jgi:hypothetical protein
MFFEQDVLLKLTIYMTSKSKSGNEIKILVFPSKTGQYWANVGKHWGWRRGGDGGRVQWQPLPLERDTQFSVQKAVFRTVPDITISSGGVVLLCNIYSYNYESTRTFSI